MIDIEKYRWSELETNKKEADAIRHDISTARGIINDALTRYIKKKVGARNKKQAEDMALMFKDLDEYSSEREIQDAYGWDIISEKEADRLIDLWRKREKYVNESGKYQDRVTDLVKRAIYGVGDNYIDFLAETDEASRIAEERRKEAERENLRFEYERRHKQ
jgi:hypothetical protein